MSKPEFTPYVDALTEAMKLCMNNPSTIFIGQQIVIMEIQCLKPSRDYQKKE